MYSACHGIVREEKLIQLPDAAFTSFLQAQKRKDPNEIQNLRIF